MEQFRSQNSKLACCIAIAALLAKVKAKKPTNPRPGQPKEVGEEDIAPAITSGYRIRKYDDNCPPARAQMAQLCQATSEHLLEQLKATLDMAD